jgi:hypothetical protein
MVREQAPSKQEATPVSAPNLGRAIHASRRLLLLTAAGLWLAPALPAADYSGLWVGTAVIEKLNRPGPDSSPWDTVTLQAAANPFPFRLLVHVDATGQAQLLQRVLTVWNPHGDVVTNTVTGQVQTNGHYVLLRDESQVAAYRTDNPDARVQRISSVNLPLMDPLPLNGRFGGTNQLSGAVTNRYDDPVNPFVHVFAPLHDNREVRNGVTTPLPDGEESWTFIRNLNLRFAAEDPDHAQNPAWGAREVGGEFRETIEGLFRPINLQGQFRLQKLSSIARLEP